MSDWDDVVDPQGRIRKGQRIRWNHAEPGRCDMVVIRLCAPMGLYRRPVRDSDSKFMRETATDLGGFVPCEANDPDAVYCPEKLMVYFRYVNGGETTGQAIDMTVIEGEEETK